MKTMLGRFKKWAILISGPSSKFGFEHRFMNTITLLAGFSAVLTLIINFVLTDAISGVLFWIISPLGIIFFIEYYLSRFRNRFKLVKWVTTLLLFPVFSYIFFINNGSHGPLLYLYMVFFSLIIFVWDGYERILFSVLFVVNLGLFFYIELWHPQMIDPYPGEKTRLLDVYLSYLIYIFLGSTILMTAKSNYIRERKKAVQSDKLKSAFLANMSHEIRTPMNAILGFSQLLERKVTESDKSFYIRTIRENSHTLLRLIEDIIDISKIEAGQIAIQKSAVRINGILDELETTFNQVMGKAAHRRVDLISEHPEIDPVILTDGDRVRQVLSNLLDNAVKHTDRGQIRFGYQIEPPFIKFFVNDTGPGIKKEFLPEVFDRFRKLEAEDNRKLHRGAGIGLSISKNLVHLLGGEIWAESEWGKGSAFYFTILYEPLHEFPAPKVRHESVSRRSMQDHKYKILIAEDETTNFLFLETMLKEIDSEIIRAETGKEAVQHFRSNPDLDLVLMDIRMPEMDGFEATQIMKSINPQIPVIAQTALAMEGDRAKSLEAGCDDYISKPIIIDDFRNLIGKYLP